MTPIAILQLDSRAWGPAQCNTCVDDEDVEEVLLTTAGEFVCPRCGNPIEGFEEVSKFFCSAALMTEAQVAEFRKTEHCCDDDCRSFGCSLRRPHPDFGQEDDHEDDVTE